MSIKAVLWDMGGTLVESWKTTPLAGIPELLQYLRQNNVSIGVATNQAGPVWRAILEQEKYPTVDTIAGNLLTIAENLDIKDALWLISVSDERLSGEKARMLAFNIQNNFYDLLSKSFSSVFVSSNPECRKPKPDMLLAACREWLLPPSHVLYVGDMATDAEAAKNAGMPFCWAHEINAIKAACIALASEREGSTDYRIDKEGNVFGPFNPNAPYSQ